MLPVLYDQVLLYWVSCVYPDSFHVFESVVYNIIISLNTSLIIDIYSWLMSRAQKMNMSYLDVEVCVHFLVYRHLCL